MPIPAIVHADSWWTGLCAFSVEWGAARSSAGLPSEMEFGAAGRGLCARRGIGAVWWLRTVYEVRYEAPISPSVVASVLARDASVEMVEPRIVHKVTGTEDLLPMVTPDDPSYSEQEHLGRVELDDAWDVTKGDSGSVIIAILDEGIKLTHPVLNANIWTNPDEIAGNNIDLEGSGAGSVNRPREAKTRNA